MDKDTFIAENLIPKNTEAGKIRKPRLNVKSVEVDSAFRKTKLTLVILGSWAIYMPPYNLARLSALTREAGYYTRVFDLNVESHYELKDANIELADAWNGANYWWWQDPEYYTRIHPTYKPILDNYIDVILSEEIDILGFSTYYTNILPTRYVVAEIKKRKPNMTIVMGGPECHEQYFRKPYGVDYYFIGESEQNILDFLNDWEAGKKPDKPSIGSLYSDTRIDIDSLPYPDYSDFDLTKYWGKNSICAEISRGCIAKCSYCTEVYYWKFRDRGAQTVVDELEYQVKKYDIKFVSFVDSLMNGNLKEFRKFCEELVKRNLGINWWGYARADGRMDLEFYQTMAAAGCQGFHYGIETGSDKVLVAINKKNTVAEINQNIIDSDKVGMKVSACWVIGAPGEDIEAFTHSFNLLWNHRARIMACSPGPGLGDNYGSLYDDRERYNLNERNKPWLGAWWTKDLKNTKLHRFIRIKLMHMWLHLCKEFGGTIQNVHKSGDITEHFDIKFDSDYLNDSVEYENFHYDIINSGLGDFADSLMNEVFGFLRMLWRVRGGYEIKIKFNKELDHKDFIFAIVPDTHKYQAEINFKIDDNGYYSVKNIYSFENNFKDVVPQENFDYVYESNGLWKESKKTLLKKIFFIKEETNKKVLPVESCFSAISIEERQLLFKLAKDLPVDSIIVDVSAGLGGKSVILGRANKQSKVYAVENFSDDICQVQYENSKPWIKYQLLDFAKENELDPVYVENLLVDLEKAFIEDNGLSAFKRITKSFSNVELVQDNSKNFNNIDLCMVNIHYEPKLSSIVDLYQQKIKQGGLLVMTLYDLNLNPAVFNKVNELTNNGWRIHTQQHTMVCLEKLF